MSQEVTVRVVKGCRCDGDCGETDGAVIERHGRHIYLNDEETKKVRDELTKALRKFRRKA